MTIASSNTITIDFILSMFTLLTQAVTIYVVVHNRQQEGTSKAVKDATIVGEVKAQLAEFKAEVKAELGFLSKSVDSTSRTVEKTDKKIDNALEVLGKQDVRITNLEQRMSKLEDRYEYINKRAQSD